MVTKPMGSAKRILITDCGSTTTALLVEEVDSVYRLLAQGEAATTAGAQGGDVTAGVLQAIHEIESVVDRALIRRDEPGVITQPADDTAGVDMYLATSSAGGGMQMLCAGLVKVMTAESSKRAALGAGAVVMDVIAIDDGRLPHTRIQRIRELRPDAILLSGGVDGGNQHQVINLAKQIAAAKLPRLPIIYAGNKDARQAIEDILSGCSELRIVDNLRPALEVELLDEARQEVHEVFLEHVVSRGQGYERLSGWTSAPIIPTTSAISTMVDALARDERAPVMGVRIDGSTTELLSVFKERFHRTVAADLGLGSSIFNVLIEAGIEGVTRWLPFPVDERQIRDRLRNRMLQPQAPIASLDDLMLEHAVAREIVRLILRQHSASAFGLRGVQVQRDVGQAFQQSSPGDTMVDMMSLSLIIAMGSVFTQASPLQAAMILTDGMELEGVTNLAVDNRSIASHLGTLAAQNPKGACDLFRREGLMPLATVVAPVGPMQRSGSCVTVQATMPTGTTVERSVAWGHLELVQLPQGIVKLGVRPAPGVDVGHGPGKPVATAIRGSDGGLIIDTRGRSLRLPKSEQPRQELVRHWCQSLTLYPGCN